MIRSTPFNANLEGIDGKEMIKFADNLVSLILYFRTYVSVFICAKYLCLVPPLSSCVIQASRTTSLKITIFTFKLLVLDD